MKYFVMYPKEYDTEIKELQVDTPLIPDIHASGRDDCNYFLGTNKYGRVKNAVIKDLPIDPDYLLKEIEKLYVSIPAKMLEKYLAEICILASRLPTTNGCYQCLTTPNSVTIRCMVTNKDFVILKDINSVSYL